MYVRPSRFLAHSIPSVLTAAALAAAVAVGTGSNAGPSGSSVLGGPAMQLSASSVGAFQSWSRNLTGKVGQAAPTLVTVNGRSAAVVGDLSGTLTAFDVTSGNVLWSTPGSGPIESAISTNGALVFAGHTATGLGFELASYRDDSGVPAWLGHQCPLGARCPQLSGMTVSTTMLFTGGPTQYITGLTTGGAVRWAYLNSDTTNSTPAVADLGGGPVLITTNDQTPNPAVGAISGGHLRITSRAGVPLCDANIGGGPSAPGSFDSSPAVASFGGAPVIVFGSGQSGTLVNRVVGYNSACQPVWTSTSLAGLTIGAPAIADVTGDGVPEIIEEVATSAHNAVVYELSGLTGQVLRSATVTSPGGSACGNVVSGTSSSVTTADLNGNGRQDLVVPAGSCGVILMDGQSLANLGQLGASCAVQNTPLITQDSTGQLGITMAGYTGKPGGGAMGCVYHYEVPGGRLGSLGWPMFHHDPQLSGAISPRFAVRDMVASGTNLASGASLVSANGLYRATMQADGSFVILKRSSTAVRWAKVTRRPGAYLRVGGLALGILTPGGSPLWLTRNFPALRPMTLVLGPNGYLYLIAHNGNQWANDTVFVKI
jgi:hypothetical protein